MSKKKVCTVLGIMTGTSIDGLDCSLIKTNGEDYCQIIEEHSFNYSLKYKKKVIDLINNLPKEKNKQLKYTKEHEEFINKEIIKKINFFLKKIKTPKKNIDLIGLSGQTIIHKPDKKYSLQLGSGKEINEKIKIPVISNFREKDLSLGGQGAPIGCFYHKYLLKKINMRSAIVNIGGVSNITMFYKDNLIGFDLGPGNALIDDLVYYFYKIKFDKFGSYAKKGKLINDIFNELKKNKYFKKKFPKSLDRNHFLKILNKLKTYNNNDSIHTASLMTVYGIIRGVKLLNYKMNEIILSGGGRKNLFIVEQLEKELDKKNIKLTIIDKFGYNGDMIESQMFGYLAVRSYFKLPISLNSITGVKKSSTGGILYKKIN